MTENILTKRQRELLECAAQGMPRKDMARELGIALPTVKTHLSTLRSKLGARSTMHALSIAYERGLM